jgi:predicted permease
MSTLFDVLTVTCFIGLVIAFFQFTSRDNRILMHFMLPAVLFAVANQVGNHGSAALAAILMVAGIVYAVLITIKSS